MAVVNSGYVKIYGRKLLSSSIWQEPLETKVVWMTLLAMADANGIVDCWTPGVAAASGVSLAKTREAIATLEAPDPDSRSIEDDGRRIRALIVDGSRCIFVVNHEKYRGFQSAKQAATAERMRKYRDKRTESVTGDTSDAECAPKANSNSNSEANSNSEEKKEEGTGEALSVFDFWAAHLKKSKRTKLTSGRRAKIKARLKDGYSVEDLHNAIRGVALSEFHMANGHTDITTIFRSAEKVDAHLERFRNPPKVVRKGQVPPRPAHEWSDTPAEDNARKIAEIKRKAAEKRELEQGAAQ